MNDEFTPIYSNFIEVKDNKEEFIINFLFTPRDRDDIDGGNRHALKRLVTIVISPENFKRLYKEMEKQMIDRLYGRNK